MSQYLIRNSAQQQQSLNAGNNINNNEWCPSYLQLEQCRISSIFETPLVKMSYNDYLIKKNDSILSIPLPDNNKNSQYQQLFKNRQTYEKQIQAFVNQKTTNGGGYYFYNWISDDELICEPARNGVPLLATLIFSFQYEKAQMLIQKWERSIVTDTLNIVFKGFVNVIKIVQNDPQLNNTFFQKKIFVNKAIIQIDQSMQFSHNKLLLVDGYQSLQNSLQQLSTLSQKIACVLANIKYLKKFLQFFPSFQINDYYKLIFAFMSNTEDQLKSKNMYNMLLNAKDLNILDRFNFVQKLIPLQGRRQFINQFQHSKIMSLTNLSNLMYFKSSNQKAIQKIITNYLDEYGDLQSVATVCLQYGNPNFMHFIDMYQQILVISCEQKKAQDLEYQQYKKRGSFCFARNYTPQPTHHLFLNYVNFNEQKIEQITYKPESEPQYCYVCFRQKQLIQDMFVQCGRCKHGGHLSHLLKWYEQSNNVCPKTDCSCYCV